MPLIVARTVEENGYTDDELGTVTGKLVRPEFKFPDDNQQLTRRSIRTT
jgi:hypothetical protein